MTRLSIDTQHGHSAEHDGIRRMPRPQQDRGGPERNRGANSDGAPPRHEDRAVINCSNAISSSNWKERSPPRDVAPYRASRATGLRHRGYDVRLERGETGHASVYRAVATAASA